jgi:4-aminobutyrate aminotransferase-like enzyme/Ser/Thr protein kinase RdoA (MazF antagonist)
MVVIKHRSPAFSVQEAENFASRLYGLHVSAHLLPGEHDQNFYLRTDTGQEFVLKIAHAQEQEEILDLQNQALVHLETRAPSLMLPRVCPTTDGKLIATVVGTAGNIHFVRLLTYIPGTHFAQANPHTPELLYSLGSTVGALDCTLFDFTHPAAHRMLKWDLQHASWIRDYLQYIEQPERRQIVERFLRQFEQEVAPRLPSLRASVIHNDGNDYNVLVNNSNIAPRQVISILDFGDMVYTTTICGLAIAATYAMLGKPDPLSAAAHVVRGYHEAFLLSEAELEVLFPLICTRLAVSVTNAAYQRHIDPGNDYLTISEQPAWALLEQLTDIPPQMAHYQFRHACGLSPCPTIPAVVQWLKNSTREFGRVVEPDMTSANTLVFNLSIGSLELGNLPDVFDTATFTKNLFERMRNANAQVGVGRYNEARPIYTSESYRQEGNDGPEWRTVHLGIDLFMEPGSPVFAPLDGIIHSFRNNNAPLDYGPTIILQHTVDEGRLTFFTLYGHLSLDSLDGLAPGMPVTRGTQIGKIGDISVNGGWPPHLHFQIITDLLGKSGDFPGVGRPNQRPLWLSLSPDPNLILGIPADRFPPAEMSTEEILALRQRHLGKNLSISYRKPLQIVRGYMQYLYDDDGRAYLDAVNNVPHVGHNHPRVVQAGQRQMVVLNTNTRYLHEGLVRYAERLCATLPEPLSVVYFVCSGSEANELALRLARAHTRQKNMLVVDVGYHGNTTTLVEISPYKFDGPGGSGAPSYVHKVPMPDVYRGPYKRSGLHVGKKYARHVAEAIQPIQESGSNIAAFICESVLGCGGQVVLPDGYLQEAYRHVRAAGGVCIADEVQTGFGRVGSHFWAFEAQGIVPDIVTMGKPIGNGHPLGAVVTTPEIAASFHNGIEYFNTFGGNPVSCAIGMAVLDVIEEERLQEHALVTGNYLMDGLRSLMDSHPLIGDVRGLGLFVGIELVRDRAELTPAGDEASYIANRMRDYGILLSTDGPFHNVLKIKPPLVFDKANADFLVTTLDKILREDRVRVG